jgi:hypothetical protein
MGNLINNNFGSTTPDDLIAGTKHPIDVKGITVLTGQGVLKRGTVIGLLTTGGKGKVVDSSKSDGTQTADCILTDDIDTSSADVVTSAYISGEFNRSALIFGGTDVVAAHEATLRQKGIFLKDVQAYEE